jgi:hypothetical protein
MRSMIFARYMSNEKGLRETTTQNWCSLPVLIVRSSKKVLNKSKGFV